MINARAFCSSAAVLLALGCPAFAQDAADTDDLASEFKGVKLVKLQKSYHADGYEFTLYTDAEHKQLRERHEQHKKKGGSVGQDPLFGYDLILEVKTDRLVLVPEIWQDHRKVRVIPFRYISEIWRAGMYEETRKK